MSIMNLKISVENDICTDTKHKIGWGGMERKFWLHSYDKIKIQNIDSINFQKMHNIQVIISSKHRRKGYYIYILG